MKKSKYPSCNKIVYLILMGLFMMITPFATAQQRTYSGTVYEPSGIPAFGVAIKIKGTLRGTTTDLDGKFTLQCSPNDILELSSLGFQTLELKASSNLSNIRMQEDSKVIDEVVVTAFGTGQKKASMVGSTYQVKPGELKVPSANLSTSFAGRLAGVVAVQRSGQPGADGADFWIRGVSSFSGVTSPLIILDGVQVSTGDLNALDPEVIEGFSILKDATATALYGSRGANGVMIVTTKSGKNLDKPIINFRLEGSVAMPTSIPEFVDGVTYMEMANQAATNSGFAQPYSREKINGTRRNLNGNVFPNVNWYDEIFKNYAFNQGANFNIRGGSQKLDYFMSVSYNHETGMLQNRSSDFFSFKNNIDVQRYSFQNNINAMITPTTKVALRLNTQIRQTRNPSKGVNDIFGATMNSNPVDFPAYFDDSFGQSDLLGLEYKKWGAFGGSPAASNPLGDFVSGYKDGFESTMIASFDVEQKLDMITKGLKLTALASFKNYSNTAISRTLPRNYFELGGYNEVGETGDLFQGTLKRIGSESSVVLSADPSSSGDRRLYFQVMLDYSRTFGKHDVNAMVIYNQDEVSNNNPGDGILTSLPNRKQGMAARLSYAFDGKYLIEGNFGYNGSENFAENQRWGFFPSIAVGYNLSEEAFWRPIKSVVSNLKLRASYGLVGNDQIGSERFIYMSDINLTGSPEFRTGINSEIGLKGPQYKRYENNSITWEVGEKLNLGLDMSFFKSFQLNLDAFREIRTDIFMERGTIPTYLGTADTKVYGNYGKVRNQGFDASLDYAKQVNKKFYISAKGTFTYAHNTVLERDEPDFLYPQLSQIGRSLNTSLGYIHDRLFIDLTDIKNSPQQQITTSGMGGGDIKYFDQPDGNGNYSGTIDANDRQYIGYPTIPEIVYGVGPSMKYGNVDFSFFIQGTARTSLMMSGFHPFGSSYNRNVLKFVADDYWNPENQSLDAKYPRLTKMDHANNTAASTYWLRDASFVKLKNAEIGYTFKGMRLYLSGTNLLTFSKFKHWDPEQGGGNGLSYPTQRVVNLGFQMTIK